MGEIDTIEPAKADLISRQMTEEHNQPESSSNPIISATSNLAGKREDCLDRDYRLRFDWTKLVIEILTLLAVIYYANKARETANAANTANELAHDNAVMDLRAYVDPKSAGGSAATEITFDEKTIPPTLTLHFINDGKTPARHFAVGTVNPWEFREPTFRTRYQEVGTSPELRRYQGIVAIRGLATNDATIPSGGTLDWELPTDAANVANYLTHFRAKKKLFPPFLIVNGFSEYCDVFGTYRCDAFSYQFVPTPSPHFVNQSQGHKCYPRPEPLSYADKYSKDIIYTALPRCEQPSELEVDQGRKFTMR
jgi:hypothetical protein